MFTKAQVRDWLEKSFALLIEHKQELTELDSAIGDGDHGENMARGFKALCDQLPELEERSMPEMLKGAGMVLLSSVGGVSGPLYGTFFLKGSEAVPDTQGLDEDGLYEFLSHAVEGLKSRGRAELTDKTMVDVWDPAVAAYKKSLVAGSSMHEALEAALSVAAEGMERTTPLIARKGRASYLGERSKGHQDPGATSSYYIIKALAQSIGG